jgi:homoserine O-acetyltransferase
MMALDVSEPVAGSMARAAAIVKANVFVITAKLDHVVTPGPALEFAPLIKARVLELESDCGHLAPSCEAQKVDSAVKAFLQQ